VTRRHDLDVAAESAAILIAPFRGNGTLLAKQLASVDSIAAARLTVGIAVGERIDDYEATDSPFHERGRLFDRQLTEMRQVWSQEPRGFAGTVGPPPVRAGGPPPPFGGTSAAAFRRMTELGSGGSAAAVVRPCSPLVRTGRGARGMTRARKVSGPRLRLAR
jgi:alkanesulfonate monooxygenase SsuD/methylene tetrahydromethanopterin reductase-like flavin-dependent oxidoreductase (luciferase family)